MDKAKLCAALVKAQEAVKAAAKDARNQHDKHDYASREGIVSTAKAALAANGLAYLFMGPRQIDVDRQICSFECHILHESGQEMSWRIEWPLHLDEKTKQGNLRMQAEKRAGMAKTYAEKNTLLGLLQIPRGAEDMDGTPNEGGYREAPKVHCLPKRDPAAAALAQAIKSAFPGDTIRAAAHNIGLTGTSLNQMGVEALQELKSACVSVRAEVEAQQKEEAPTS